MLRYASSIPTLTRVFIMNGYWILSNAFSASSEMIMWFLSFLLLMWHNTLICLYWTILVTLEWIQLDDGVWFFLCIVDFSLLIFCWGFLHLYSSKILACNFLFLWCLCLVLVSGKWWPHRLNLWVFPPLQFLELLEKDRYKFFICLVAFPSDAIQSWVLFYGSFFVCLLVFTDSISLLVTGLFKLSVFSWLRLGSLYVSRNLSVSSRLFNLLAYNYS